MAASLRLVGVVPFSSELTSASDRLRATLDSLVQGFQIVDAEWRYVYVNPAAARQGQQTPDALVGRTMMECYAGIDQTPLFSRLRKCLHDHEAATFENQFTFPTGERRWFEIRVEPVPEGICIQSVDIQARKDAEAAAADREREARLGEMAAFVAHEVRNPLAALSSTLQLFRGRCSSSSPDIGLLDEMLERITVLNHLIEDLLVLARPMTIERQPVVIQDLIAGALRLLERDPLVQRHAVLLPDDGESVVVADPRLLTTVVQNVVLNAAQAMTEDAGTIRISISRNDSTCLIAIADSGTGVAEDLRERIFDPFFTTKGSGSGLGLAISRRVMRLHGGDLQLASGAGPGATFLLAIPRVDRAGPTAAAES